VQLVITVGRRAVKLITAVVRYFEVIPVGIAVRTRRVTKLAGETTAGAIGFEMDVITLVRLVIAHGVIARILGVGGTILIVEARGRSAFPGVQRGVNTCRRADIALVGGAIVEITAVRCASAAIDNLGVDAVRVDAVVHGTRAAIITVSVRRADAGAGRVDARSIDARVDREIGLVIALCIQFTTTREGLFFALPARQTNVRSAGITVKAILIILAAQCIATGHADATRQTHIGGARVTIIAVGVLLTPLASITWRQFVHTPPHRVA